MALVESAVQLSKECDWPAEVRLILSALEAGQSSPEEPDERRELQRRLYRVRAQLRLFADPHGAPPWVLYTRDVNARSLGFICRHRLPLGYGGVLKIALPDGRPTNVGCTLLRCRESVQGWYDGALYFNREQFDFGEER